MSIDAQLHNADWAKRTWDVYYKGKLVTDLETLLAVCPKEYIKRLLDHPGLPLKLRKQIEAQEILEKYTPKNYTPGHHPNQYVKGKPKVAPPKKYKTIEEIPGYSKKTTEVINKALKFYTNPSKKLALELKADFEYAVTTLKKHGFDKEAEQAQNTVDAYTQLAKQQPDPPAGGFEFGDSVKWTTASGITVYGYVVKPNDWQKELLQYEAKRGKEAVPVETQNGTKSAVIVGELYKTKFLSLTSYDKFKNVMFKFGPHVITLNSQELIGVTEDVEVRIVESHNTTLIGKAISLPWDTFQKLEIFKITPKPPKKPDKPSEIAKLETEAPTKEYENPGTLKLLRDDIFDFYNIHEKASESKNRIVSELATRLKDNDAFNEYAWRNYGEKNYSMADYAATFGEKEFQERMGALDYTGARYEAANRLIRTWANTSGDHDPMSVTVQEATRQEFGLDEAIMVHMTHDNEGNNKTAYLIEDVNIPAYRAFVREMYNNTQEFLDKYGVQTIFLWRGLNFPDSYDLGGVGLDITGEDNPEPFTVKMQPASSWTFDEGVAHGFARSNYDNYGSVLTARVPRQMILGTAMTGFGAKDEGEIVVLGQDSLVRAKTWRIP